MKKTGLIAAVAALSAAAGALAVGALYLRRREKELDEYEDLLFGDDDEELDPVEDDQQIVEVEIEPEADAAPAEEEPAAEADAEDEDVTE